MLILSTFTIVIGCKHKSIQPSSDAFTKAEYFKSDANNFKKVNHHLKDFKTKLNSINSKEAWPKITVTFTFGGFQIQNNPCLGGSFCGICTGLCFQFEKKEKLAYEPLTPEEVSNGDILFTVQDLPNDNVIVLYPESSLDNGDGYFYIDGDHEFSDEVNDFIGRDIKLKNGAYLIDYSGSHPFGAVIIDTY